MHVCILLYALLQDGAFTGVLAARRSLGALGAKVPLEFPTSPTESLHSACAISGTTVHERFRPVTRNFRYNVHQYRFDLRAPPAGFSRNDHFGDTSTPLDTCVRQELADRVGLWPTGRIETVCNLRCVGLAFNPITAFFAHEDGKLAAMLLEVHNTPWGERSLYAMRCGTPAASGVVPLVPDVLPKAMHVSPFNRPPTQSFDPSATSTTTSTTDKPPPPPLYRFKLVRHAAHDMLSVEVRDPLATADRGDDDKAPLIVRAKWTMGHVAPPGTPPQHEVRTGSWRAIAQVYWQAFQMFVIDRIPLYKYDDAPSTPIYFGIVAATLAALLFLTVTLVRTLGTVIFIVVLLLSITWSAATYGWRGPFADSLSMSAVNAILERYSPHTRIDPMSKSECDANSAESTSLPKFDDQQPAPPTPVSPNTDVSVRLRVPPASFVSSLASMGELHLGESYVRGDWSVLPHGARPIDEGEALAALMYRLTNVSDAADRFQMVRFLSPSFWMRYLPFVARFGKLDRAQSADLIHEHYDEMAELYRAFLGPCMVYTSAMFEHGETTRDLQVAQMRKVNRILDLARVEKGTRLLDIGCGFGTLCGTAATRGAEALGICNSQSMIDTATEAHGTEKGADDVAVAGMFSCTVCLACFRT